MNVLIVMKMAYSLSLGFRIPVVMIMEVRK